MVEAAVSIAGYRMALFLRRAAYIAAASTIYLAMAGPGQAQALKATILGTITDSSGASVPNAQLVLTETNTNFSRTTSTNESGYYAFANLDPGTYRVEAQHPGFRHEIRAGIDLLPDTTARMDIALVPGRQNEVVTVTADAPLIQADRADTGGKIEPVQIQAMPMIYNRNYQSLISLMPGVGRVFRPNSEFYNSQDSLGARVNGAGRYNNNYELEGVDNNFDNGALTGIVLPAEAIGSVDVSTSNYDPEFGNSGGSVTSVTMRSGTNQFHGSLFEFNENTQVRAAQPFGKTKPPIAYNQFGGAAGGRIIRDKLFFFGDYQGSRDHYGSTNIVTIPTLPFRNGDFSASPTIIYDPASGAANGTGRQPFPNQQIPAGRIDAPVQALLSHIPAPTSPGLGSNYSENTVRVKNLDSYDGKVDYVMGAKARIAGRFNAQKARVVDPIPSLYGIYGGPHNSGFDGMGHALTTSSGLSYSHIFSPTLVMELRTGYVRNANEVLPIDYGLQTANQLGISNVNLGTCSPGAPVFSPNCQSSGMPQINVTGFDTPLIGSNGLWIRTVTNWGVVDNFTKSAGTHLLKWGFDIRRQRNDLQQPGSPRGLFSFTQGPASLSGNSNAGFANAFASVLLDMPNSIQRGYANLFPTRREWLYNAYFQDKWQVFRKLTIDLGIRWEDWPAGKPTFPGGYSNYTLTNNTLVLAGIGANPIDLGVNNPIHHFAPRLGVAYRFDEKTVIRAGYGISFLPRVTANWNYPITQATTYSAPNSFSAAGSLVAGLPPVIVVNIPSSGVIPAPLNQAYRVTPPDWGFGYLESWNVAVERILPGNFALTASYVGSHSVNMPALKELNYGQVLGGGPASQKYNQLFGQTASIQTVCPSSACPGTPAYYDGLQVTLNRRLSKSLLVTTSYTYSKALDYFTDFDNSINPTKAGNPYNQFMLSANKARSDFDVRHVYAQSFVYSLPFGKGARWANTGGVASFLLGGWQLGGIFTAQGGIPLNITFSNSSLNTPLINNRPNLACACTPQIYGNVGPGIQWFNTADFAAPPSFTIGNVGRNILSGPSVINLDASLARTFSIREMFKVQLRADSFNFSNTPHYDNPNTTFGSSTFGQVTTAGGNYGNGHGDPRQFEFSLKAFF
jgi:hypothetical protein